MKDKTLRRKLQEIARCLDFQLSMVSNLYRIAGNQPNGNGMLSARFSIWKQFQKHVLSRETKTQELHKNI